MNMSFSKVFSSSLLLGALLSPSLWAMGDDDVLDISKRPPYLQKKIEEDFKALSQREDGGHWVYKGTDKYKFMFMDDHTLATHIIRSAPPEQQDFYFMDIGAGNFSWGESLANFINAQADLQMILRFIL